MSNLEKQVVVAASVVSASSYWLIPIAWAKMWSASNSFIANLCFLVLFVCVLSVFLLAVFLYEETKRRLK